MVCETWQTELDSYFDGDLPSDQMRALDNHMRSCASCATDILARVQIKRAVQVAGRSYVPRAEFRRQLHKRIVVLHENLTRPAF